VLYRRTPFHQLQLADHFGGRRFASIDVMQGFSSRLEAAGLDKGMVNGKLLAVIKQHAAILALSDAFLLASYLFLGLAGLVWLAYPTYQRDHPTQMEEIVDMRAEQMVEEQS
jgi:DHA2 family multidrug resistance protein